MEDHLTRLLWAFPLVIAVGVAGLFWLKRLGIGGGAHPAAPHRDAVSVLSRTQASPHTHVMVIQQGPCQYLVFESSAQINVQQVVPELAGAARGRVGTGLSSWLVKGRSR